MNVLTCEQWVVGSKGKIQAEYTLGGVPKILVTPEVLEGSGLCGSEQAVITNNGAKAAPLESGASQSASPSLSLPCMGLLSLIFLLSIIN